MNTAKRWTKAMRKEHFFKVLSDLGFTHDETSSLLRIEKGLNRWHTLECGTGTDKRSESVERDEATGKPFVRIQYRTQSGEWRETKSACRDMEKSNLAMLASIMEGKSVRGYVQTDPRGCSLYIIRPNDVPEGKDVNAFYSRGIAVCF